MNNYTDEYDITKAMIKTMNEGNLIQQENSTNENGVITPDIEVIREFENSLQEKTGGSVSNSDIKIYMDQSGQNGMATNVVASGVIRTPINIEFTMDLSAANGLYVSLDKTQLTTDGALFLQKFVGFYGAWESQWGEKIKEF